MFYPETLPAEKRSVRASQEAVDRLMEYDRKLAEDFTAAELHKLFIADEPRPETIRENYSVLTDTEKELLRSSGFALPAAPDDDLPLPDAENIADRRRQMKASVLDKPVFDDGGFGAFSSGYWSLFGGGSRIFVWLDNMCFGNSKKTGFYYVRDQLGMYCGFTTAYAHPLLIVQKKKLRPDQIEYMERKCRETLAFAEAQKKEEAVRTSSFFWCFAPISGRRPSRTAAPKRRSRCCG